MNTPRLTIDLAAIARNWTALNRISGGRAGAVVKADAYGLGVEQVAPALARAGARSFFVATAEEGFQLRRILGPGPEIFVFSGHMPGGPDLPSADIRPLLNSPQQVADFLNAHPGAPHGLQLDSGMNRLGVEPEDIPGLPPGLSPSLVISHLACADLPDHDQNASQLDVFRQASANWPDARKSLAATGGTLLGADYHFDMVRPGIGLYGGLPFAAAEPVVRLSLPVLQHRIVRPGETVGYAASWTALRESRIATLPAGYADGLLRTMGEGRPWLYAGQTRCPLVGRISMDLVTVDITDLPDLPAQLDLLNAEQTIDDVAGAAGTIGYEILTALGPRFERVYIGMD